MTATVPYIKFCHRIAAWTGALRIATKSLGHKGAFERSDSERTGVVKRDEVASPFS